MRYNPQTPWGGTDNPQVPDVGLDTPPIRRYGGILYNLPDLAAFRALDHTPLNVPSDYEMEGTAPSEAFGGRLALSSAGDGPLVTRRLLGALSRTLTRYSAILDQAGEEYDPSQPEAGVNAAFYLRLAGYPFPAGLPDGWALALLRYLPNLWPVGRVETYLRTAEIIYGRGTRATTHDGENRTRSAVTAGGVGIYVIDAQQPGADRGRSLSVMLSGPVSDEFVRLIAALRPAAFSAIPSLIAGADQALLPYGETP